MSAGTIVVSHFDQPQAWRPAAPLFLHVQAGSAAAALDLGMQRDDRGDHISERNARFGELTAIYWAWRNLPRTDFVGFAHYRRYFVLDPAVSAPLYVAQHAAAAQPGVLRCVSAVDAVAGWLRAHDVILPQPRRLDTLSLAGQYARCHHAEDFACLLEVLRERHRGHDAALERFAGAPRLHCCNMFIAGWGFADAYLGWLFPLLFELERRLPVRTGFQRRSLAFLAERLIEFYLALAPGRTAPRVLERPLLYLDEGSAAKSRITY